MSILQDVFDLAKDMTAVGDDITDDVLSKKRFTSVSRQAKEGTLQFPVIISKSIPLEDAQMISKALEKEFASMLQTTLTMNPFLNLATDKNAAGYLRRFHQNSDIRTNVFNDVFNTIGSVGESDITEPSIDTSEKEFDEQEILDKIDGAMEGFTGILEGSTPEMHRSLLFNSESTFGAISESTVSELYRPLHPIRNRADKIIMEATSNSNSTVTIDKVKDLRHTTDNRYQNHDNKFGDVTTGDVTNVYNVKGGPNTKIPGMEEKIDYQLPRSVLVDNDVKKANELISTSMHVRTILTNRTNQTLGHMDFMIGVKAMMHPVSSDDIIENVSDGIMKRGKFFKFVRWTTGEIEFVRDFLFNVKDIKQDVSRSRRSNDSRWWSLLKRRRKISNLRKHTFLPGNILPNTTLVVSTEEVDYLKNNNKINLEDISIIDKLMDYYFLLGIVIVDSSTGVAKFLFDGDRSYNTVTFSGLERGDLSGRGADIKDVIKLVQRI